MQTKTIGAFEAKTHFSGLLEQVRQGTMFIVTLRGKPVAQLGPASVVRARPVFGSEKGRIKIREDFDDPLPEMAEYEK